MELYTAKVGKRLASQQLKYLKWCESTLAGSINGYDLYIAVDKEKALTYYLTDNSKVIAFLYMEAIERWKAMEEAIVWTDDAYRGRGLVPALYDTFIKRDNGILISDNLHTKYAVAMWKRYIKTQRYNIYAINLKNPRQKVQVWWDNEHDDVMYDSKFAELWTDSTVRGAKAYLKQHDIRFVAHA